MLVGTTEGFDASLVLLAGWAGWGLSEVRYASRARQYNEAHPGPQDWDADVVASLHAALDDAGESAWHAAATAAWDAQAAAYDAERGAGALARQTVELRRMNALPRSDAERDADRELRRRRFRPP